MIALSTFKYTDWTKNTAMQQTITNDLLPSLERLSPGGGAYLNEADPNQVDWQQTFYGDKYHTLLEIKRKYDPHSLFYAFKGVGSEAWLNAEDGRLCRPGFLR
jgi:hypothetical protein